MKVLGIIPARMHSTRLPGKPLMDINGKTMIERVWNQASKCSRLDELIIATDHIEIYKHCISFGAQVIMTSEYHNNGTERCAEVLNKIKNSYDIIINIQGDEPFLEPNQLDEIIDLMVEKNAQIASLYRTEVNENVLRNSSVIKVVTDNQNKALYFSRSLIPFVRDSSEVPTIFKKHVGIYAFKTDVLQKLVVLSPSEAEKSEKLEQLRWLENGYAIYLKSTIYNSFSIDTPEDLEKARSFLA